MDDRIAKKMLTPYLVQLKRLASGLGMPLESAGLEYPLIKETPIVRALSRLQEIPSETTIHEADYLIDLLTPFYSNPLLPAGYGAVYLPAAFWRLDLGRYIFNHYLYGSTSLFVSAHDAKKRMVEIYGKRYSKAEINSLIFNRTIPSYMRFDEIRKAKNSRYIRLDHIAQTENLPAATPPLSRVKTAFPPHKDNYYFPWQRTLFALCAAFGLPGPSDILDTGCKIVRSLNSVFGAAASPARNLRSAAAEADFLIDVLVPKGIYEIPVPGWGAAYLDASFWRWEAGEKIFFLYKSRFGSDLLSPANASKLLKLSNSQRMQIYLHIRNREFPSYPIYSQKMPVTKKVMRVFRRDHVECWQSKHAQKKTLFSS
jgi:hypothetical protein